MPRHSTLTSEQHNDLADRISKVKQEIETIGQILDTHGLRSLAYRWDIQAEQLLRLRHKIEIDRVYVEQGEDDRTGTRKK
jgi:hypothetical protein